MKQVMLFLMLALGACTAGAQNSVLKKCVYESPDLSFSFLYPSYMEEIPTVRPHVKKHVVDRGKFGFIVGAVDMEPIISKFEQDFQLSIEELVQEDEVLLWMLFGNSDYKKQGFKVINIERGYMIDNLPTALVTMTATGQMLDRTMRSTSFYFVLFYNSIMINLAGTVFEDDADTDKWLERFKALSATFSIVSQYSGPSLVTP